MCTRMRESFLYASCVHVRKCCVPGPLAGPVSKSPVVKAGFTLSLSRAGSRGSLPWVTTCLRYGKSTFAKCTLARAPNVLLQLKRRTNHHDTVPGDSSAKNGANKLLHLHFRHACRYVPRTSDAGPAECVQRVPHYFRARRLYLSTGLKSTKLIDFSTLFMTTTLTKFPGDKRLANPSSNGAAGKRVSTPPGKLQGGARRGASAMIGCPWPALSARVCTLLAAKGAVGVCGGSFFVRGRHTGSRG